MIVQRIILVDDTACEYGLLDLVLVQNFLCILAMLFVTLSSVLCIDLIEIFGISSNDVVPLLVVTLQRRGRTEVVTVSNSRRVAKYTASRYQSSRPRSFSVLQSRDRLQQRFYVAVKQEHSTYVLSSIFIKRHKFFVDLHTSVGLQSTAFVEFLWIYGLLFYFQYLHHRKSKVNGNYCASSISFAYVVTILSTALE